MVTTTENFLQRLSAREQWNLKETTKQVFLTEHAAVVKLCSFEDFVPGKVKALRKCYGCFDIRILSPSSDKQAAPRHHI